VVKFLDCSLAKIALLSWLVQDCTPTVDLKASTYSKSSLDKGSHESGEDESLDLHLGSWWASRSLDSVINV
jgi:hypothetical protein